MASIQALKQGRSSVRNICLRMFQEHQVEQYFNALGHPRSNGCSLADHIINLSAYSDFSSDDFNVNLQFYHNKIESLNQSFYGSDFYRSLNTDIDNEVEEAAIEWLKTANIPGRV